jgi:hypothetical protein
MITTLSITNHSPAIIRHSSFIIDCHTTIIIDNHHHTIIHQLSTIINHPRFKACCDFSLFFSLAPAQQG